MLRISKLFEKSREPEMYLEMSLKCMLIYFAIGVYFYRPKIAQAQKTTRCMAGFFILRRPHMENSGEFITVKLSKLKPDKKNARKHSERNIDEIARSLRRFGQHRPFVVQRGTNKILVGNGMYEAMKSLGWSEGSVLYVEDDDETAVKRALADNRTGELAEWDWPVLKDIVQELGPEPDIPGWNDEELEELFDLSDLEQKEFQGDEDEVPDVLADVLEETVSKLGDIYALGEHRLICGDCTDAQIMSRLMESGKADMVFADPPYGMGKAREGIINDNLNQDKLLNFNKRWIPLAFEFLEDNGSFYCWGTDEPLMDIYSEILKPMISLGKLTFRNLITWDKGAGQGQLSEMRRMYASADEKCLFVMCGIQKMNVNADNYFKGWEPIRSYLCAEMEKCGGSKNWRIALGNQMGKHYFTKDYWEFPIAESYAKLQTFGREYEAFGREYEDIKREYEDIKREYLSARAYFDNTHDNMNSVWHFDRTSPKEREDTGGHATPKPVQLVSRAVKTSCVEGGLVLDPFGGSGTTIIACEKTSRICRMVELDPHYCDVIVARWEKFTGKKAEILQ
jgi:DNA modification methylase